MDICSESYLVAFNSLVGLLNACLSASLPLEASVAVAMRQASKDLHDAEVVCDEIPELAIAEFIKTGNLERLRKNEQAN